MLREEWKMLEAGAKEAAPTILVVDDDFQVLSLLREILALKGYRVLTAPSGREGLDILRENRETATLAILDIQMPDMSGERLFMEMKTVKPGLKVLISSGYDEKTALHLLGPYGPEGFIQKPYRSAALEGKVREILGG